MSDPLRNLRALRHKLHHHDARVSARYADKLRCGLGCTDCCQTERTVSDVEYAALQGAVASLPPDTQGRLASQTEADHCTLLLDGGCAVYAERPLICRSHGLPLLMDKQLDVCPLNFTDGSLPEVPIDDVLSVDNVTAVLVAVNALYCQEEAGEPRRRRPVSDLFAQVPNEGSEESE